MRPDLRYSEIVKYYYIVTLKRGHSSYKTTFSLQKAVLEMKILNLLI
jgi:hypothetical protein